MIDPETKKRMSLLIKGGECFWKIKIGKTQSTTILTRRRILYHAQVYWAWGPLPESFSSAVSDEQYCTDLQLIAG